MRHGLWALLAMMACVGMVRAQDVKQWREKLVGQPLYLRGFWSGMALEFDGAGKPMGGPVAQPMTLSGVDVTSVEMKRKEMVIHANRVALAADDEGRLVRRVLSQTTMMLFTYQKEFHSKKELRLLVHADAQGSFDAALQQIFVNGLKELATVAPPYWNCYAQGFFVKDVPAAEAQATVDACAEKTGFPTTVSAESYTPPQMVHRGEMQGNQRAAELGLSGECDVRVTVGPHGVPVRFRVVRALGAGIDEEVLQGVSTSTFEPAKRDGVTVPADYVFRMRYRTAER
jgi:hypothetical protein